MAEYIDREALMEKLEGLSIIIEGLRVNKGTIAEFAIRYKNSILRAINEFSAADVEPVKHGRWMDAVESKLDTHTGEYWEEVYYNCLECDYASDWNSPYCPNCGAKMDGE